MVIKNNCEYYTCLLSSIAFSDWTIVFNINNWLLLLESSSCKFDSWSSLLSFIFSLFKSESVIVFEFNLLDSCASCSFMKLSYEYLYESF